MGLVLGFFGLILLVGPSKLGAGRVNPIGATVLILASLSWATGSVSAKHLKLPRSPLLTTGMQSLVGGVLLILASVLFGRGASVQLATVSTRSLLALGYLIVFGSLLGLSAYNWLLHHASPARVATYAYVNPIVAMLLGWALAGEAISVRTLLAAAIIIVGVVLVISASQKTPTPVAESREPLEVAS